MVGQALDAILEVLLVVIHALKASGKMGKPDDLDNIVDSSYKMIGLLCCPWGIPKPWSTSSWRSL